MCMCCYGCEEEEGGFSSSLGEVMFVIHSFWLQASLSKCFEDHKDTSFKSIL